MEVLTPGSNSQIPGQFPNDSSNVDQEEQFDEQHEVNGQRQQHAERNRELESRDKGSRDKAVMGPRLLRRKMSYDFWKAANPEKIS